MKPAQALLIRNLQRSTGVYKLRPVSLYMLRDFARGLRVLPANRPLGLPTDLRVPRSRSSTHPRPPTSTHLVIHPS